MYNGMMNVYKEKGYTSSDVVARLRGILKMKKIGHTGTLDPDAEGVLPVCLGNGTKICDLIADRDKEYIAVMRLGVTTDTQDMTGTCLERMEDEAVREAVTQERLLEVCKQFIGSIDQIPPMYSAVKINGKRLYQLARQGKTVERKPRQVQICELEVLGIDIPLVKMRVRCSKGTYIRTLCHDIGQALGTGAAMESLLRTRVGTFRVEDTIRLDDAEAIMHSQTPARIEGYILPVDSFFDSAPRVAVRKEGMRFLMNGNQLERRLTYVLRNETAADDTDMVSDGSIVRIYGEDGRFYALYRYNARTDRFTGYKMFLP